MAVAAIASATIATRFAGRAIGVWEGSGPNAASVRRLDGSTITAAEIDATVERLIGAAKVTGAGMALLTDGKIAYLKAMDFAIRRKICR